MAIYILTLNLIITIAILIPISIYAYRELKRLKNELKLPISNNLTQIEKGNWSDPHINGNLTKKTPKVKTDKDLWERDQMR